MFYNRVARVRPGQSRISDRSRDFRACRVFLILL